MSKRVSEFENLFDIYNRSLQIVWPGIADTFVCPLCMAPFKKEDIYNGNLSLEHVPPRSIGAACKTMTCTRCNNTIGTKLQRFMANDVRRKELEAGKELKKPFRARVRMPGLQFDAEITSAAGRTWTAVSPLSILPPDLKSLEAARKIAGAKGSISLKGMGTKEALDRAYLHSSYLALFSLLGYPYIMQPFIEEIRQHIVTGQPSIGARIAVPNNLRHNMPFIDPRDKNVEISLIGIAPHLEKSCFALVIAGELVLMPLISDRYKVIWSEFNALLSDAAAYLEKHPPFDISLVDIDPSCKYAANYVFGKGKRVGDFDTLRLSPVRETGK